MRLKFICNESVRVPIDKTKDIVNVHLLLTDQLEDHDNVFAATPAGAINLGNLAPSDAAMFDSGAEFYIEITPIPPEGN